METANRTDRRPSHITGIMRPSALKVMRPISSRPYEGGSALPGPSCVVAPTNVRVPTLVMSRFSRGVCSLESGGDFLITGHGRSIPRPGSRRL
jgi:hypothetical protein